MERFSTAAGGLLLKVRKTDRGWESSIASTATILDEQTAKSMAEKFASRIVGRPVENIQWQPREALLQIDARMPPDYQGAYIQKRLDLLDESFDALERAKAASHDDDGIVREGMEHHQRAREYFSKRDFSNALYAINYAEGCIIVGRREVESSAEISQRLEAILDQR